MAEQIDVVVIGAGPAGLSVSHELSAAGVEHVVLERGRVGQAWQDRWESFRLVTPNWSLCLPGGAYEGDDPDGFMPREEIVRHLRSYASSFCCPVREGVSVTSLRARPGGGFSISTDGGELGAATVVLATGAYQRPYRPEGAVFPAGLTVLDVSGYTSEPALPPGAVLVIGSGQTGCQLAEEIRLAGREVVLSCGKAPWAPRRLDARDIFWWTMFAGALDDRPSDLPSRAALLMGNGQSTGHGGGHDLHYRTLQGLGVTLVGRFLGADGRRATFASDLEESVAFGDARYADLCARIARACDAAGVEPPEMPAPPPFHADAPTGLDLDGLGAVLVTTGFRPDYGSWVKLDAFDELGFPRQVDGASTVVPGLFFCGVHFLRSRKSSLLFGVGEDATVVARAVVARTRAS